jgi:hypothetical protein
MGIELKGGEGMSFPTDAIMQMQEPFYFAIDIRSDAELLLGRFPKVRLSIFLLLFVGSMLHIPTSISMCRLSVSILAH